MKNRYESTAHLSGITINDILNEPDRLTQEDEKSGLFLVKPTRQWIEQAKRRPIPRMLFSEFWHEGELCILFADTNLGKSILAVQIADSISRGVSIKGFRLEAQTQAVLYGDFEMTDKQLENRYSFNYSNHYNFDQNFYRLEINPDANIPEGLNFEEYLHRSLEQAIMNTKSKILIVDNLTYLKNETERAKDALPLMKHLKNLKKKFGLSILALAHTPKRDLAKPITRNDLQGSKMLINFCDSAFAIGESHSDKDVRYIKQIKARNTEIIYDAENVCICQIEKPDNFLSFGFMHTGKERDHLKQQTDSEKAKLMARVTDLKAGGRSLREIGNELGISHMRVSRILKDCNGL